MLDCRFLEERMSVGTVKIHFALVNGYVGLTYTRDGYYSPFEDLSNGKQVGNLSESLESLWTPRGIEYISYHLTVPFSTCISTTSLDSSIRGGIAVSKR